MLVEETVELPDGIRLHCAHRQGSGRRWAVFLHGACMDHNAFAAQLPVFDEGWSLLLPDLRGQGRSTLQPGRAADFDQIVGDVHALFLRFGIGTAVVIGHSLGASVAQEFAFRHPQNVERLVLMGCYDHHRPLTAADRIRVRITAALVRLLPWPLFTAAVARMSGDDPAGRRYIRDRMREAGRKVFLQLGLSAHAAMHPVERYAEPRPALILRGEADFPKMLAPICDRMLRKNPLARAAVVERAAHNCQQDNPEACNRLIADFISGPHASP